jgi:hypothetical protein
MPWRSSSNPTTSDWPWGPDPHQLVVLVDLGDGALLGVTAEGVEDVVERLDV